MRYEKSLIEILQWKESASDELYNLTLEKKLDSILKSTQKRCYTTNPNSILPVIRVIVDNSVYK